MNKSMHPTTTPKRGEYPELAELASNVALVLALRERGELHFQIARQVVKGAVWWASNALGRNYKSLYWTSDAIQYQADNPKWVQGNGLINEHVIPRTLLEKKLLDTPTPSTEDVLSVLKLSFTCLVTAEENDDKLSGPLRAKMPKAWKWGDDPFARYRDTGITWHKR